MQRRLWTVAEAAEALGKSQATIRGWVHRGYLEATTYESDGRPLYLDRDVYDCERDRRHAAPRKR